VYDLGVIDLPAGESEENSFIMPYNGWVQRVGVTWPAGSNNVIGLNVTAKQGLLDEQTGSAALERVDELQTFFPKNHPNPEYITDDDRYVAFRPIKYIPARAEVEADILNGSATSQLDLQVRVTVTNFDPRSIAGGSASGDVPPGGA
jgi:hypothetical protein